jgi:hypothetical protein
VEYHVSLDEYGLKRAGSEISGHEGEAGMPHSVGEVGHRVNIRLRATAINTDDRVPRRKKRIHQMSR